MTKPLAELLHETAAACARAAHLVEADDRVTRDVTDAEAKAMRDAWVEWESHPKFSCGALEGFKFEARALISRGWRPPTP